MFVVSLTVAAASAKDGRHRDWRDYDNHDFQHWKSDSYYKYGGHTWYGHYDDFGNFWHKHGHYNHGKWNNHWHRFHHEHGWEDWNRYH